MSTELQKMNGQQTLAIWAERIAECRNSGLSVKTWCKQNQVCEQTYHSASFCCSLYTCNPLFIKNTSSYSAVSDTAWHCPTLYGDILSRYLFVRKPSLGLTVTKPGPLLWAFSENRGRASCVKPFLFTGISLRDLLDP